MKTPFTLKENEVSDLLIKTHNAFLKLERTHSMEEFEWIISFHRLQDLLSSRILRRDYPDTFTSKESSE